MAADSVSVTEQWIREKLSLQHRCLADVRSLSLPGSGYETGKICHLGISLKNFVRLKSLDLSYNVLDSVQGIVHLKLLEKLNLYYNRISSLEEVLTLCRLQNLQELDLRLNPVVQKHPHYRLYLVHAISKLRKLDDCAVRDRERRAALMHFSVESALEPDHMHAVRILCMMEQEVVGGEEEMEALKQKIQTLNSRAELQQKHHQSEIQSLTNQLQRAHASIQQLDEQLRSVLEENVSLQKQLIRLEQKLLSDHLMCRCTHSTRRDLLYSTKNKKNRIFAEGEL
uniref:Centrosomal protein of 72 kDa n=1 Tax=Astyanax mexicanus TaxID=7994 RepID=A0A8B9JBG8_ASTMX